MGSLREKNKKKNVRYWRRTNERANSTGSDNECSVILFFYVFVRIDCVFVVARSTVILIVWTAKRRRKGEEKKRERRARVHINVLQHCTLDNYDLWPKRMRAENIILSKDSHCHWSIVNNNINNNINNNNSKSIDIEH